MSSLTIFDICERILSIRNIDIMNSRLLKCGDSRLCAAYTLRHVHDLCLLIFFTHRFWISEKPVMYSGGTSVWTQFRLPHQVSFIYINLLIKKSKKTLYQFSWWHLGCTNIKFVLHAQVMGNKF